MKGCWFCETLAQSTPRPGIWEGAWNTKKHSYPICWGRREGEWTWNQRLLAKGKRAGHTNFQAACWATLTLIQQHWQASCQPACERPTFAVYCTLLWPYSVYFSPSWREGDRMQTFRIESIRVVESEIAVEKKERERYQSFSPSTSVMAVVR